MDHQTCIDTLMAYFQERNINCIDFEQETENQEIKRPDLLLPDHKTLIEVKTFKTQQREREEQVRIEKELNQGRISTYRRPVFFGRFEKDLKEARRKFRRFPDYSTLIVFFDFHSDFHRQKPEILLSGQEYITIGVPKDPRQKPYPIRRGFKNRSVRWDKNKEIGAIAFHWGHNAFKVYHNHWADEIRKINKAIFNLQNDKQWEFIDNPLNPEFKPIV